jgi:hypothetical protein
MPGAFTKALEVMPGTRGAGTDSAGFGVPFEAIGAQETALSSRNANKIFFTFKV